MRYHEFKAIWLDTYILSCWNVHKDVDKLQRYFIIYVFNTSSYFSISGINQTARFLNYCMCQVYVGRL